MPLPSLLARLLVRTGAARFLPGLQRRLDGGADFLRYCSDRLLAAPVGLLEEIAAGVAETTPDIIDLAPALPRFELTPSFTTRLPVDRRGWPDSTGLPELRGSVAAKLLADNRLAFSPAEEVLVTSGALGAAGTILDAFVNRHDQVALLDPISPLYPLLLHTRGARVRWVGTRTEDGRLRLRFDHLSRALRGARLLILNSPANPTGGVFAVEDLEQIAWWGARSDVLILSDEVFERFAYDISSRPVWRHCRARARAPSPSAASARVTRWRQRASAGSPPIGTCCAPAGRRRHCVRRSCRR
jgi:aspartate aminotransferase